ncbi:hypothetical protein MKUB_25420 [Mycobacterium kubicae]|uniref:DUF732 domain-containing protein n=1 Tax=Mycobacterium kubicae TaxID=120959 RepID=A0AAX1JIF9_9MYCO|nr:DUF732 domain-containing protein [Mycobacterium kubicae]MCV7095911.1 DUF732 domain-containing protein [Mycobacterium kubicae]ORV99392.1 hypothetical protein AWC13_11685 [Mycobacterium kubicae]QNI07077.1 DUF732 domain-containing protein [Mycobacterium kubicae]QNI12084.1 DUF732 domain-containing protein [Mycobacterium kubicae]QPI40312.1 DUF732 domain-containing protein [Mycobacterium kubicae]
MLRLLLAPVGVLAVIGLAVPANGEPQGDDAAFLAALDNAGIVYNSPGQAIASAKAVCGLMSKGETGLQVVNDIKDQNPGMTLDAAAKFAAVASNTYCPEHLTPKGS